MALAAVRLGAVREAAIHFSSGPVTLVAGQAIRLNAVNDDIDPSNPNQPNARAVHVRLTLLECGHPGEINTPTLATGNFDLRPGECASVGASASPNSPQTHVWALASGGIPGGGCIRPSLEVYEIASGQTTTVYPITEERDSGHKD